MFFYLTKVGAALMFNSKCDGCEDRIMNVQLHSQDHSVVIREGGFKASLQGTAASTEDASKTWSVTENEIPIENWDNLQPVDLLILCTQSNFKFYLNGKHIKSLSSPNWHNSNNGSFPNMQGVKWSIDDNVKVTKLAWTYGKC